MRVWMQVDGCSEQSRAEQQQSINRKWERVSALCRACSSYELSCALGVLTDYDARVSARPIDTSKVQQHLGMMMQA